MISASVDGVGCFGRNDDSGRHKVAEEWTKRTKPFLQGAGALQRLADTYTHTRPREHQAQQSAFHAFNATSN